MKNKLKNIVLLITLTCCSIAFANDPDGAGGNVDPQDIAAPIDSNLIFLAIAGMAMCYCQLHKKFKTE